MKTRLLKPLIVVIALYLIPMGMVSAMLTSPAYADESTQTEEHTLEFNDKKIKLVLGSDDKNQMIHGITSDDHVFISVSADEEEISALSGILSKLAETEWDQLDESEKQEIIEALEQVEDGVEIDIDAGIGAGKVFLAVILIFLTFGLPFTIVALILIYKHRKRRQRDRLITKFIDAGKDVPIEILVASGAASTSSGNPERGIMLMGLGIGLFLFLGLLIGWDIASVALIPFFLGVARVVIWSLGKRTETKVDNQ